MTRPILAAAALALGLAALGQPAAAFSTGFDLPRLTFPEGGITLSSKDCAAEAARCAAPAAQD